MFPGFLRIVVPAGSQSGDRFATFFSVAALRMLVDVKTMESGG